MTQPQTAEPQLRDRMIQAVASPAVSVVVIDVKRLDVLVPFTVAASGITAIHETLELLAGELDRRCESLSRGGPPPHPLVLFTGDAGVLTRRLRAYWDDRRAADGSLPGISPAVRALEEISFLGRAAGMHVKVSRWG